MASSVYGIPRATQDVDLVAELFGKHVEPLVALLSPVDDLLERARRA